MVVSDVEWDLPAHKLDRPCLCYFANDIDVNYDELLQTEFSCPFVDLYF